MHVRTRGSRLSIRKTCLLLTVCTLAIALAAPAAAHAINTDDPYLSAAVRSSGPIAYELKSLRSTTFTIKPYVPMKVDLIIVGGRSDGGDLVIGSKSITTTGTEVVLATWNGLNEKGQRLPRSGSYMWSLRDASGENAMGPSGYILVTRTIIGFNGTSKAGQVISKSGYMIPGGAKCYLNAWQLGESDTLSITVGGPYGFYVPARNFAIAVDHPIDGQFVYGPGTFKYRGIHTFGVSAKRAGFFRLTVIQ